jgi:hypothetical protein
MTTNNTFALSAVVMWPLALMACITHLKHTTGSIITVDAGRRL